MTSDLADAEAPAAPGPVPPPAPDGGTPRSRWPRRTWHDLPPAGRLALITYAVTQSVLIFWWLGFYPGITSPDTVTYVVQVTTSSWKADHSVLYDALVWLSLRASGGLGLLTFVQTAVAAAGLAYAVTGLRRLGAPAWMLVTAAGLMLLIPAVWMQIIYVSKDTGFVVAQIWLLGTMARIVARRVDSLAVPAGLVWALFAELSLVALFRQNGFLVALLTGLGAALVLTGLRWKMVATGVGAVAVSLLANLAIYPALGVKSADPELVMGPTWADIAVAYRDRPETFTPADLALMAQVAPLTFWWDTANCYSSDTTVAYSLPEFQIPVARAHEGELFDLWLRVLTRTPGELMHIRLCRGSIAWNPLPGPPEGRTIRLTVAMPEAYHDRMVRRMAGNPYADVFTPAPLSPQIRAFGVRARGVSTKLFLEPFTWRGVTYAYLAYLAVALWAARRRSIAALALVAVILGNQLTVLVNNPNQLVRYMAAPMILGILLLPLAFAALPRGAIAARPDGLGTDGPDGPEAAPPDGPEAAPPDGPGAAQNLGMPPN